MKKIIFFKRKEPELRLCGSLSVKPDDGGGDGPDLVQIPLSSLGQYWIGLFTNRDSVLSTLQTMNNIKLPKTFVLSLVL